LIDRLTKYHHLLLFFIFISTPLIAIPRFALESGSSCILCHVDPSGGGLRNDYGIGYGLDDLSNRTPKRLSSYSGIIFSHFQFGGDIRIQSVSKQKDEVPVGLAVFPMQANIQVKNEGKYHTALVELATLRKDVGFQLRVNNLIPNGYFKFGLSKPSYGLKIEDHTAFIRGGNIQLVQGNHREGMPFIPTLENVGLMELGFYFGDTFISVSRTIDGYILGSTETYVGRIEHYRSLRSFQSVAGASFLLEGDLQIFGLFGGLSRGNLSWMGEVDVAENWILDRSIASYSEFTWRLKKGLFLMGRIDFFDENMDFTEDAIRRTTFGLNYVPLPFVDIKFQIRSSQLTQGKQSKGLEFLSQLHLWF